MNAVKSSLGFLGAAANSLDVLSGANDIIVLRCNDGTMRSSPFTCRFGRFKCIRSYEKIVRVEVNGELNPDVYMKIGGSGEAYFIAEARGPVPAEDLASPLGSPGWTSPSGSPYDSPVGSPPVPSPISALEFRSPSLEGATPGGSSPSMSSPSKTSEQPRDILFEKEVVDACRDPEGGGSGTCCLSVMFGR